MAGGKSRVGCARFQKQDLTDDQRDVNPPCRAVRILNAVRRRAVAGVATYSPDSSGLFLRILPQFPFGRLGSRSLVSCAACRDHVTNLWRAA